MVRGESTDDRGAAPVPAGGLLIDPETGEVLAGSAAGGESDFDQLTRVCREAQQRIKSIGFDPIVKSHAETVEYFNSEVASWGRMTRAVGYSVN